MFITKIAKIRNHRVFMDFAWPQSLPPFGKRNVIYGWNGTGKTTLSRLFRALEKRADVSEGIVSFGTDNGPNLVASALSKVQIVPQVRVFNADYITASVFRAGGAGGVEPIFVLGEESAEKQQRVDELKKEKETAEGDHKIALAGAKAAEDASDSFAIEAGKAIRMLLTQTGGPFNNYDKASFKVDINRFAAVEDLGPFCLDEAQLRAEHLRKDARPMDATESVSLTYGSMEDHRAAVGQLLATVVVTQTIQKLQGDPALARWVEQGLPLHLADGVATCGFCDGPLQGSRLAELSTHFNDEWRQFSQRLKQQRAALELELVEIRSVSFPPKSAFYDHLANQAIGRISMAIGAITGRERALEELILALELKKDEPFEIRSLAADFVTRNPDSHDGIAKHLAALNTIIECQNSEAAELAKTKREALNRLHDHYVTERFREFKSLADKAASEVLERDNLKAKVESLKTKIEAIESEISEHRQPATELNAELQGYLGHSDLQFAVEGVGYRITRAGRPASNLSEGEKTAVAFLHFLKSLRSKDFDLKTGVVVVDDPISSLDANAIFAAFGRLNAAAQDAGQLFVLTHNFAFFRQVKSWLEGTTRWEKDEVEKARLAQYYMLETKWIAGTRTSEIKRLDRALLKYESEYHYCFSQVYREAHLVDGVNDLERFFPMPNIARRMVETFLAFRHPDRVGDLRSRMGNLVGDPSDRTRLLRFLNTFSHGDRIHDPVADLSFLAETRGILTSLLGWMEAQAPGHYAGMVACCGGKKR